MANPRVRLELQSTTNKAIQLQTHPNIDKELFKTRSIIGLKNPAKPFPLNTGMLVLNTLDLTYRHGQNKFIYTITITTQVNKQHPTP